MKRAALAFALAATFTSCLSVRSPESGARLEIAAGEALVFGRVRCFDRGHEFDPWTREVSEILVEKPVVKLALFQVETGKKRPDVPIETRGAFEWIVPAGTYLVYHTPTVDPPYNEPLAAFQVRAGEAPIDLGELWLDLSVDRALSAELATYTLIAVDARPATAESAAELARRHPGSSAARSGAWIVDPELRRLFENWSVEACARVLARHGVELARVDGR